MQENETPVNSAPSTSEPGTQTAAANDAEMIEAFIDKSEKTAWYQHAFSKYNIHGIDKMAWNWSWWAFFGGIFYLLYRKAYLAALGLFGVSIVASFIPFAPLVLWILTGGYSPYFVYKTYQAKKFEVESRVQERSKQLEAMRQVGGYHTWVIWLAALFGILFIVGLLMGMISAVALMNQQ